MSENKAGYTAACLTAIADGVAYPSFSETFSNATLEDAYSQQIEFVNSQPRSIAGYKAALTAQPAQAAMGIDAPIFGCLFDDGERLAGDSIEVPGGGVLETELGYTLAQDISSPVSEDSVLEKVEYCQPMIEIARPNLSGRPGALDLIATNSASYCYIKGAAFNPLGIEVDAVTTALSCEDETVFTGTCGEVMAGQRAALTWLINSLIAIGYKVSAGHILMTGSVGGVAPAKAGAYSGDFGAQGQIHFTIT